MQENKVFRQAALDRLASPEQLHTLMQVTDAKGWLALLGCGLMLAAAVTWGIFGHVPTKVAASGILIHSGGLAEIVAVGEGQVTALEVEVGDYVEKGQVIAEIAQPELSEQLKGLRARLAALKQYLQRAKQASGQDVGLRLQASARQRKSLEDAVSAAQNHTQELEARVEAQTKLLAEGLITKETLEGTRQAVISARLSVQSMQADMQRLMVDNFSAQRANEVAVMSETMQVQETERQIKQLEERFAQNSHVISTHAGRVVEVRVDAGRRARSGSADRQSGAHAASEVASRRCFTSIRDKESCCVRAWKWSSRRRSRARSGTACCSASVRIVERFPSTRHGMMRALAQRAAGRVVPRTRPPARRSPCAPRLVRDKKTPSGYRWSSRHAARPDAHERHALRRRTSRLARSVRSRSCFPALDLGG